MKKIATLAAVTLALAACGKSDKASEAAQADNVEMPAEEAVNSADDTATPLPDATGAASDAAAPAASAAASDSAAKAAEAATRAAENKM